MSFAQAHTCTLQAPQAAARSRAAGREKTETKTERKGKGKTANAPTARRLDDGGGYGGGGAIAASRCVSPLNDFASCIGWEGAVSMCGVGARWIRRRWLWRKEV